MQLGTLVAANKSSGMCTEVRGGRPRLAKGLGAARVTSSLCCTLMRRARAYGGAWRLAGFCRGLCTSRKPPNDQARGSLRMFAESFGGSTRVGGGSAEAHGGPRTAAEFWRGPRKHSPASRWRLRPATGGHRDLHSCAPLHERTADGQPFSREKRSQQVRLISRRSTTYSPSRSGPRTDGRARRRAGTKATSARGSSRRRAEVARRDAAFSCRDC